MGEDSNARFVKYSACNVARQDSGARQRNWLGRWDRCRAGISTGWGGFYRIASVGATASSKPPTPPLPHCVCQTAVCCANRPPEALRAAS